MDSKQFDLIVANARARQDELLKRKGADYTRHSPDRLANFKRIANDLHLHPETVWGVYAGKHWDAIMAFIGTGKSESEGITGRLDDLHNYLYLLEGILTEKEEEGKGKS